MSENAFGTGAQLSLPTVANSPGKLANGKPSYKVGDRVRPSEAGRFLLGPACADLGKVGKVLAVKHEPPIASRYFNGGWFVRVHRKGSKRLLNHARNGKMTYTDEPESRWYRADLWSRVEEASNGGARE